MIQTESTSQEASVDLAALLREEKIELFKTLSLSLHHELRNALTPIYLGGQLLDKLKESYDTETGEVIADIFQNAKQLRQMLDGLNSILKAKIFEPTHDIVSAQDA